VPHSTYFLKYLCDGINKGISSQIKTGNIIDNTPNTRLIHASYFRVLPKTCCFKRDYDRGKPRPDIFIKDHSIMGALMSNNIGNIDKLYTILKPIGYDFPEIIKAGGMIFELCDIRDPVLTDNLNEAVKPIMTSQAYTALYKDYIKRRRNKIVPVS